MRILLGSIAVVGLGLGARVAEARDCEGTSTGLVPLTDLGSGSYQGFEGGLYPGGGNTRPAAHEAAGLAAVSEITPRDALGNADPDGVVGLVSIGMSNTHGEFARFMTDARLLEDRHPNLVIFNGAIGGRPSQRWSEEPDRDETWGILSDWIDAADSPLTHEQVQILWIKQARTGQHSFPGQAQTLRDDLEYIVTRAKTVFPNLKVAYLSSRIYAGYASIGLSPESAAYETAFAVKWLIEDQMSGDPALAFAGPNAPAPWLSWGPYLWADGLGADNSVGGTAGRSDGLEYECLDFADNDGTHPASGASGKVSSMLIHFFTSDATAVPWFTASGMPSDPVDDDDPDAPAQPMDPDDDPSTPDPEGTGTEPDSAAGCNTARTGGATAGVWLLLALLGSWRGPRRKRA